MASLASAAGLAAPTLPKIKTKGPTTYNDWKKEAAPPIDDSVVNKVNEITSQDSPTMQLAETQGLQTAASRGLTNSSMAVGAAQDAVIAAALPMASQDAAQAYGKNMASQQYQYDMASQFAGQQFQSSEAALNRELELAMQTNQLTAEEEAQIRQIASTEGIEAANRELAKYMQGQDIEFQTGQSALDRQLELAMQANALTAEEAAQIREIEAMQGEAAADRALQQAMQAAEMANQQVMQYYDIANQQAIANMNLNSSDRNSASTAVANANSEYQASYEAIMANTNLDAATREQQLAAAKAQYDTEMSLVEQLYDIDLYW